MSIPRPKRGWHIAQRGEYCPRDNTALWADCCGKWDYNPLYGGYKWMDDNDPTVKRAIRNHLRNIKN